MQPKNNKERTHEPKKRNPCSEKQSWSTADETVLWNVSKFVARLKGKNLLIFPLLHYF